MTVTLCFVIAGKALGKVFSNIVHWALITAFGLGRGLTHAFNPSPNIPNDMYFNVIKGSTTINANVEFQNVLLDLTIPQL